MSRAVEKPTIRQEVHDAYVMDTDYHLHVPMEKVFPYVRDEKIRELLEQWGAPPMGSSTPSLKTEYGTEIERSGLHDRAHGVAISRDEIVESKNELGIDVAIVQPGTHIPFNEDTNYPVVATEIVKAYNDYVLDNVIDVERGVWSTLVIPEWNIDAAIAEIERVGDNEGFVAVQNWMNTTKPWGHPDYDPLIDTIVDYDFPIFLHVGGSNSGGPSGEKYRSLTEGLVLGLGYDVLANAVHMVMTGLFDKYPDLDVALQESGTTWIPYAAYRMDEQYQNSPEDLWLSPRMHEMGKDYLDKMPSEYVFDNLYTATQPIEFPNYPRQSDAAKMMDVCRSEETFMYSSDWPHITVDIANWLFDNKQIDDETRKQILHGNTEDVIRLPN